MRLFFAALLLCLFAIPLHAKPSSMVTEFSGDRYSARVAQVAQPAKRQTRARYIYHAKKHPFRHPAPRSRPRQAPGLIAPLTLAYGLTREVGYAAGMPRDITGLSRGAVIGGRPSGCPSRFCGCGASLHLFGRIIPALNLAANWLRFPRASPAPNMVAARRGHVFVLKQHIAGNVWLAHDSNSGGRRTRIHPRSIAGFAIVNPHGRV